jgi:tight adherence protein B
LAVEIVAATFLAGAAGVFLPLGFRAVMERAKPVAAYIPRWKLEEALGVAEPDVPRQQTRKTLTDVEVGTRRAALLILAGAIAAGGIAWTVTGLPAVALAASVAGLGMPKLWANWQSGAKKKQLGQQLEAACERMAAYIRTGGSLLGAMEAAAKASPEPLASLLNEEVAQMRIGVRSSEVLEDMAKRTGVPEMKMLALASALQEKGLAVNLGAVFAQVQDNIRGRRELAESLESMTAENRLVGTVVAVVPFATLGIIRQLAPDFVRPLFETPAGLFVFGVCTAVIIGGIIWVFKIGDVAS